MAITEGLKAQPDVGTLNMEVSPPGDTKVTLDIEDAPFLQEWNEPKPAPAAPAALALQPDEDAEKSRADAAKKKKKILLAGAVGVLLLALAGTSLWWFKFRTPPPPPVTVEPEVIKVPAPPKSTAPSDFVINFAPFWVELPDGKGGVVFLVCKFAAITHSELLLQEAQGKMTTLRDALYYYLRNKPYLFLIDPANAGVIKKDLNSVLSGYLAGGKIDDLLFESYLAK